MRYYKKEENERNVFVEQLKSALMKNNSIIFAYLFGSFLNYNDKVGFRDVDIAIYFLKKEIDPVSESLTIGFELSSKYHVLIDCIPINIAPLYLRFQIFREGRELFCRNYDLKDNIVEKTATEALDYMSIRDKAIRELV